MTIKELLVSMSSEERNALPYERLCNLRMAAFKEHVAAMTVQPELSAWDAIMRSKYGQRVKVWHMIYDSFLVALMVVRYGEDCAQWPDVFSAEDIKRAQNWELGSVPQGVEYLQQRGAVLAVHAAAWAMVGIGLAALDLPLELIVGIPLLGTAMTDYLENKLADHLFRTTTFTQPTVLAVGLFTAAPGETGGGTEVTGGSYARVSNNPANANWNGTHGTTTGASSGTGGVVSNAGTLTFPAPTANWGVVTHHALFDAASAGNMLIYGALTVSKTVNNGDPAPSFAATALAYTFA